MTLKNGYINVTIIKDGKLVNERRPAPKLATQIERKRIHLSSFKEYEECRFDQQS